MLDTAHACPPPTNPLAPSRAGKLGGARLARSPQIPNPSAPTPRCTPRLPHRSRLPSALRSVMPLGVHPRPPRATPPSRALAHTLTPPPGTPRAAKRVGAHFTAAQVEAAIELKPHLQRATDQETRKAIQGSKMGAFEPQRPRLETQHVPTTSPHHCPRVALTPFREHISLTPNALTHLAPSALSAPHIIPKTHSATHGQVQMATMLPRAGIPTLTGDDSGRALLAPGTHAKAAELHSPPSPPRNIQNTVSTVVTVAPAWEAKIARAAQSPE